MWVNVSLSIALCLESVIVYGEAPYEACAIAAVICLTAYSLSKQLAA